MNLHRTEKLATIILILITVGAASIKPAQEISPNPLGGAAVDKLLNALSYLILSGLIAYYWKGFLYVSSKGIFQLLLLILILFSVLWSVDMGSSLTFIRGLLRIYLLAVYLAMRYTFKEQIRFIALGLGITTVFSIIFPLIPSFGGIHTAPELAGMWSGIFGHKNELGYMMAWSAGVFLHLALSESKYRWLRLTIFGLAICLIILSRSTTSLMIVLTMIALLPLYKLSANNNYKLQIIMISFVLILLVSGLILIFGNAESIVGASGKDLTFSGRTDLWEPLFNQILERPLFGYGYAAFWNSPFASNIRLTHEWASNSHNGFFEIILDVGIVGFCVFAIGFIRFITMALHRVVSIAKTPEDYLPMQMLALFLILNISEARLLTPSWNWFMYLTTSLSLTMEYSRMRKKASLNLAY
ncbi:lipid A core-O-antigen ligase-like enyme [Rivularia sp. PCC 7116]|uniref:O-antigen ligase family protein n=1 Tax=Rivularia sp. PCC 7116 TaxID=373994 RepID=UPI00029EF9A2|nr:O-antigen ligase [Rivularia sp. PCC 7116]AFY57857.1 lipid A core-O-antigen ligase-like enyme [Rivularia sp. PCC 7116]